MKRLFFGVQLLIAVLSLATCQLANAQTTQEYSQSAGVRFGATSALTYKKFLVTEEALEIMVSGRHEGLQLTTMYVFHVPMDLAFSPNFYAYYGAGGHFGFEERNNLTKILVGTDGSAFTYENGATFFTMGADFLIGVEYRWLAAPITVSFDVKPYFDYIGFRKTDSRFWDSAISFKYIF
ncbi:MULTISPECIES: hypothetical protein [unclassified Imperialibacter]|jgi:hypothetical protein|uniref:hypothetical protein n=1 Tax=unclassified Imperialibacter TaxID=2629706 RepID=UPI001252A083|nr:MULTISPECIES: hypothetical protein [unclassified Imperialibacter]CAD5271352.1 conserved exported hypothetical protein [Imperialibacter sp. 89]CAD5298759.1 conserved exported hypothetical protein [Imperialibacter sp. 75]VVT35040.1 conserved exported hypothetical protein [Imperialibacter sp. EC-SDR9]